MVKSISMSSNENELILSCASGNTYRCLTDDLTFSVIAVSHASSISCIAFGKSHEYLRVAKENNFGYYFATATKTGEIRVWDLTDYACLSITKMPKSGAVLCLCVVDNNTIISGFLFIYIFKKKLLLSCYFNFFIQE
jgi:WD40 repeat protein